MSVRFVPRGTFLVHNERQSIRLRRKLRVSKSLLTVTLFHVEQSHLAKSL